MGPYAFDCSGFVLRAFHDIGGKSLEEITSGLRHVRDIWQAALNDRAPFRISDLAIGNLAVTARTYTINGERVTIPGHIGIITDTENLTLLHANPAAGMVEEKPLASMHNLIGAIALEF